MWSHIDDAVPDHLYGDPGRLRQVLLNLLGNAVKFTTIGDVSVIVEMITESAVDCTLKFSVKDTGVGIQAKHMRSIFQPFTQIDNTNKRTHGGTGLGLTISSQIVQAMGSVIEVENHENHGAIFSFIVTIEKEALTPLDPDRLDTDTPPDNNAHPLTRAPALSPRIVKPTILLVEDNEVNRKVTLMQLQQLGLTADTAENGQQAVNATRQTNYDIILMDCQMPVMDGFEATRTIRLHGDNQTRIIALTANAMKEDRIRCLSAGMDDYLSKPVSAGKLAIAIGWPAANPTPGHQQAAAAPPTPRSTPTRPIDFERLREVTGDNNELLREISDQYLQQAETILADMEAAVIADQSEELAKLAHKLAGSSATCGMTAVVPPLRRLELLKPHQTNDALNLLEETVDGLARIRQALCDELDQ